MQKPNLFASFLWLYPIAFLLGLVVTGLGINAAIASQSWELLVVGVACIVGVLVTWPLAYQLHMFDLASSERGERALTSINERFEQFSIMLNLISEQQLLSDRAKVVAFREKDSDALRRAIQDEILKQSWEAAESLAGEMERSFGYKQEADRLRAQIEEHRQEVLRRQISDAVALVDLHTRSESWNEALADAQKLAQQYPDVPQAVGMPQEVENRRAALKKQLVESWNDAVARHDVDGSIEILKRLDAYLTPTEAEGLQETARGVFKEKLNILRAQFALAVQDHKWAEALRLADTITSEFPNTQMAKEVREMMDSLRSRASGMEPAPV